jgi:hypothetical protein
LAALSLTPDLLSNYQAPKAPGFNPAKAAYHLNKAGFCALGYQNPKCKPFPAMSILYNRDERHKAVLQAVIGMWKHYLGIQTIKLVNDLDLRVISPNGNTNFPWVLNPDLTNQTVASRSTAATTGDNIRDNVEQVYLANPTNGTYTVRVTHKGNLQSNATQWVSVLLSGITPQQPPSFKINQILQTATNSISLGWPAVVGQRYQVQYVDAVTATNWANIGAQVSARLTNVVVAVVYTNTVPQRFYRAVQVP